MNNPTDPNALADRLERCDCNNERIEANIKEMALERDKAEAECDELKRKLALDPFNIREENAKLRAKVDAFPENPKLLRLIEKLEKDIETQRATLEKWVPVIQHIYDNDINCPVCGLDPLIGCKPDCSVPAAIERLQSM